MLYWRYVKSGVNFKDFLIAGVKFSVCYIGGYVISGVYCTSNLVKLEKLSNFPSCAVVLAKDLLKHDI
jgi:hypothetical protein